MRPTSDYRWKILATNRFLKLTRFGQSTHSSILLSWNYNIVGLDYDCLLKYKTKNLIILIPDVSSIIL